MFRDRELMALEKYLRWLRGFEESGLYRDYRNQEGFTDEEYAEVKGVLEGAVRRRAAIDITLRRGRKLFHAIPPDGRCSGCGLPVSLVFLLAQTEQEAQKLVQSGKPGLCGECMYEMITETQRTVIHDLVLAETVDRS